MVDFNELTETNETHNVTFTPVDNTRLAKLCGQFDEHLHILEKNLGVEIHNRGNSFHIKGPTPFINTAGELLNNLYDETQGEGNLNPAKIHLYLQEIANHDEAKMGNGSTPSQTIITNKRKITPRGPNQNRYLKNILSHDINFGVGPAGTGKTYLAVACAVAALDTERVNRILLVRPAVEAGERLGFLPGDLAQKVDPYLRPLYDALYEMLGFDLVNKYIERNVIEIAPLAYMRGRTLDDSFIILDEGQNTTKEQMKMFLTRIGFGSIAVITGDLTQIDLPKGCHSGLKHAVSLLHDVKGISITRFCSSDVVRHPLVQNIIEAYEETELKSSKKTKDKPE